MLLCIVHRGSTGNTIGIFMCFIFVVVYVKCLIMFLLLDLFKTGTSEKPCSDHVWLTGAGL